MKIQLEDYNRVIHTGYSDNAKLSETIASVERGTLVFREYEFSADNEPIVRKQIAIGSPSAMQLAERLRARDSKALVRLIIQEATPYVDSMNHFISFFADYCEDNLIPYS